MLFNLKLTPNFCVDLINITIFFRIEWLENRAEANEGQGTEPPPQGDHFSKNLFPCQPLLDLNIYFWRILKRNDAKKHGFINVKK